MSLRKDRSAWIFIGALLAVVGVAAYLVVWPQLKPHVTLQLGNGMFRARVISAQEYAENGVQTISELTADQAVIRVHDSDNRWPIDMAQRQGDFDLVWLDKLKKVVHIVKNASSESETETVFSPLVDARYVIELRGGTVEGKTIAIGDTAYFDEGNIQGLHL